MSKAKKKVVEEVKKVVTQKPKVRDITERKYVTATLARKYSESRMEREKAIRSANEKYKKTTY